MWLPRDAKRLSCQRNKAGIAEGHGDARYTNLAEDGTERARHGGMTEDTRKIVIIGGGIAGLCAGVYARRCGYQVEVLEKNETAGGLASSWRRGDYIFENCLHWLLGSNPSSPMHARWHEVFDISKLTFVNHEEDVCLETERGYCLNIYANVD